MGATSRLSVRDLEVAGRRVLVRCDLNVPLKDGMVASDTRIRASLPTIRAAVESGAAVMLLSHLGRPVEGEFDARFSLEPVAQHLGRLLGQDVRLVSDWLNGCDVEPGQVVQFERLGYFAVDPDDTSIFHRTVGLRDEWANIQKRKKSGG